MAKKRKPAIRFKGFMEEWEQCRLSDIATMKARIGWQGLTQKEFLDKGDYYLITGTDFENGQINFTNCHFISKDRYEQDTNIQVKNGDVLITKDGTIGKVAYIRGLEKPATLNTGVFVIKGKDKNVINLYLYHYLAAPFLLDYASKQATGGTIKHLNQNVLVSFPIPLPKVKEQQKIGNFFRNLDYLITLHQRKYDKLQNIKKSMLEKMFPKNGENIPEIRFKGFTEVWEQRKLGEYGYFYYGHSAPKWSVAEDAKIPCVRYGELYTKFGYKIDKVYSYTNIPKENLIFSKGTEVLIPRVGEDPFDYNHCAWISLSGVAIGEMISVYNTKQNPLFTVIMFNATLREEFAKRVEGGSVTNLYYEKLNDIDISFPCMKEQIKIAKYFYHLDHLINLHKRKLEKLQNIKKSCLEKMFV